MRFWRSRSLETFLLISLGAVLGANLRYWVGGWAAERLGAQFPFGTLMINLTGSLILGFFLTLATQRFLIDPRWRVFFTIGFLGSYTTFSTYTYESVALMTTGHWVTGLLNLLGSALLGGLAAGVGVWLGRLV
jgi:CrcB protein|uniref:Fluoride-specific ion channel FluC n=1 Tax=Anaerolinea thermolimosa TaxID=229919 RepID=A0A7C4KJ20_9CHLR